MVLAGHVDDSSDDSIYTLAGWLSSADRWKQFSDDFEKAGLPHTFHMKRVRRHAGKRVRTLAALTREHTMFRVDCALHQKNYLSIAKGRLAPQLDNPYFFLFYQIILAATRLLDLMQSEDTVDWVFDEQGQIGSAANGWYLWIKNHAAPNIKRRLGSTPIFRDDNKVLPLKAADLFAWQIRKYLSDEQPAGIEPNEVLASFLDTKYGVSCNMRGEDLEAMVGNMTSGTAMHWRANCGFHLPKTGLLQKPTRF